MSSNNPKRRRTAPRAKLSAPHIVCVVLVIAVVVLAIAGDAENVKTLSTALTTLLTLCLGQLFKFPPPPGTL